LNVDVDEGKIDVDTVDVQEEVEDSETEIVGDTVGEFVGDSEIVGESVDDSEIVGESVDDSEIVGVAENEQVELGVSEGTDDNGLTVTATESVLVGENEEVSEADAPRVVEAVGVGVLEGVEDGVGLGEGVSEGDAPNVLLAVAVDDAFGVITLVCDGVSEGDRVTPTKGDIEGEGEGVSEGDIPPSGVVEGDGETLLPPLPPLVILQITCSACLDPVEEPTRSTIEQPSIFSLTI
jgi:hypothetical protein